MKFVDVAIGDVEGLHVERNRIVGVSYLDIEDIILSLRVKDSARDYLIKMNLIHGVMGHDSGGGRGKGGI
jgi:hypothetical protein